MLTDDNGLGLSSKQVKEIAGNAMHVPTIGCILVWTVAKFELPPVEQPAEGGEAAAKRRR